MRQKWRASDSRARTTRAVARRDRRAAVAGDDIRDQDEFVGELRRAASRSTKHFWLARIVARITSGGMSRNSAVEFAHQHDRPFDQAGDLVEQALVLDQFEPLREGEAARVGRMMSLRRSASSTTLAFASAAT